MIPTIQSVEDLTLNISIQTHVHASLEVTFESLLEQVGPANETPDGKSLAMVLEAWPGGRWYRDLGGDNGHLWGHVQAIKRPTLLEMSGPLFASFPFVSNVQYRLTAVDGGTLIAFHHLALGFIPSDLRSGVTTGWNWILDRTRKHAEARLK